MLFYTLYISCCLNSRVHRTRLSFIQSAYHLHLTVDLDRPTSNVFNESKSKSKIVATGHCFLVHAISARFTQVCALSIYDTIKRFSIDRGILKYVRLDLSRFCFVFPWIFVTSAAVAIHNAFL